MPQVTLTTSGTNYNLLALLYGAGGAIGSNLNSQGKENCCELSIRSDPTNAASKIYVGDGAMGAANPPAQFDVGPLNPGDSYKYGNSVANTISLVNKFLHSDTNSVKVDVTIVYA
jgi:hypothetical protein